MLRRLKDLRGYNIHCKDGELGNSYEFYFDDESWTIRYLVADTGKWLPGRLVLISPESLGQPGWDTKIFPVNLTQKQVENSPEISKHQPVSRAKEKLLGDYYGWPPYWAAARMPGTVMPPASAVPLMPVEEKEQREAADEHLRRTREVIGYKVSASDRIVGHVDDFIVDDENWKIRYLVVNLRKWFHWLPGGKKVLVAPAWIESIVWRNETAYLDVPAKIVKNAPRYNESRPVTRDFEITLFKYFEKPEYWVAVETQMKNADKI